MFMPRMALNAMDFFGLLPNRAVDMEMRVSI
jgi:hypothetical protein